MYSAGPDGHQDARGGPRPGALHGRHGAGIVVLNRWLGKSAPGHDGRTEAPAADDIDPQSGVRLVSPRFPRQAPLCDPVLLAYLELAGECDGAGE